jgi:hypothetical protein
MAERRIDTMVTFFSPAARWPFQQLARRRIATPRRRL